MADTKVPAIIFALLINRNEGGNMPEKYTMRSKEEKLAIVRQVIGGAPVRNWESQGIRHRQVQYWTKAYLEQVEAGLEQKGKLPVMFRTELVE